MADYSLVGRCGIYCGSCGLYRAYKDNGEYLKQVSKTWEIPIERIRCEGCHVLTPQCCGSECRIVKCLNSKDFEYCFQCKEYEQHSCEKYEEMVKKWAHDNVDLRVNLEKIKSGEVKNWLNECEARFKCQKCNRPLPVYRWNVMKRCYHCGAVI